MVDVHPPRPRKRKEKKAQNLFFSISVAQNLLLKLQTTFQSVDISICEGNMKHSIGIQNTVCNSLMLTTSWWTLNEIIWTNITKLGAFREKKPLIICMLTVLDISLPKEVSEVAGATTFQTRYHPRKRTFNKNTP